MRWGGPRGERSSKTIISDLYDGVTKNIWQVDVCLVAEILMKGKRAKAGWCWGLRNRIGYPGKCFRVVLRMVSTLLCSLWPWSLFTLVRFIPGPMNVTLMWWDWPCAMMFWCTPTLTSCKPVGKLRGPRPKLMKLSEVEIVETTIGSVRKQRLSSFYKPRPWRWANIKHETLSKIIVNKKSNNFHPYVYITQGISTIQLSREDSKKISLEWSLWTKTARSLGLGITRMVFRPKRPF